jgi:anti-sigma factor RsiW
MSATPEASQATLEQLTAYLDGELDAELSRQIEERLAAEPALRQQLQHLEQAWRVLDDLPRQEVAATFASTTLAMAAVREADSIAGDSTSSKPALRWLLGAGLLAGAAAVGFGLVALTRPQPNQLLLEDLPVIENLDAYRHAESIEYLRKLKAAGLFDVGEGTHAPRK